MNYNAPATAEIEMLNCSAAKVKPPLKKIVQKIASLFFIWMLVGRHVKNALGHFVDFFCWIYMLCIFLWAVATKGTSRC